MKQVITVLIFGIISGTLCISIFNPSDILSRKARYAALQGDHQNFDDQLEQYLITIKSKCDSVAGNEDAFNTLMEELLKFLECVTPIVDNFDLNALSSFNDALDEFNTTSVKRLFVIMCPDQHEAFLCVNNLTYTADICLTSSERELKNNLVSYVKGLANFVCTGNGEPVLKFLNNGGINCLNQTLPDLIQCRERFNDILETEDFLFALDATMCNEIKNEKECIMRSLQECPGRTTQNLYNDYFNATWNATSCRNHF